MEETGRKKGIVLTERDYEILFSGITSVRYEWFLTFFRNIDVNTFDNLSTIFQVYQPENVLWFMSKSSSGEPDFHETIEIHKNFLSEYGFDHSKPNTSEALGKTQEEIFLLSQKAQDLSERLLSKAPSTIMDMATFLLEDEADVEVKSWFMATFLIRTINMIREQEEYPNPDTEQQRLQKRHRKRSR